MSTPVNEIEIRLVDSIVCEINLLKQGSVKCANDILLTRREANGRLTAMKCLMENGDSSYDDIIEYLYEQLKELTLKLNTKL